MVGNSSVDTLLFADDQAVLPNSDSGLEMILHSLTQQGFRITDLHTDDKMMAFHGADPIRAKIVSHDTGLEHVGNSECLGCYVSYIANNYVVKTLHKLSLIHI